MQNVKPFSVMCDEKAIWPSHNVMCHSPSYMQLYSACDVTYLNSTWDHIS